MLSRRNRFHGHGSVRRAYRTGRPVRGALMSLHVVQGEQVRHSRVAVVVSRKVHKSAVRRNRIRRRIYENFRPRIAQWQRPREIVVTVYQAEIADMPAAELAASIDDLLGQAKLS